MLKLVPAYSEAIQRILKYMPCDVIKMRGERRSGKGNPLKRDRSIDVTRLIFRTLCRASLTL